MNFFLSILMAIAKRAGEKAAPFVAAELPALANFGLTVAKIELDFSLSSAQKKMLRQMEANDFKTLMETLKIEGSELASDIPEIIAEAGADQVMGAFGFDKAANAAASTLPQ